MYEKDGREVLRRRQPHALLGRQPGELGEGRTSSTPRAGSSASTPTRASGRPRRTGRSSTSRRYSEEDLMKDVFEDGYVDVAVFQPTYLKEWYTRGLQHHRAQRRARGEASGQVHREHPLRPARRRRRPEGARGERRAVGLEGRQALHRRVEQRLARLQAQRPGGVPLPGEGPGARDQEHPRPQGPDDLAAGQGRVRRLRRGPRGDGLPGAELHRRARRACRASRTSASWRRRSPTSTPACRWSSAA